LWMEIFIHSQCVHFHTKISFLLWLLSLLVSSY
jgi:hypothetical protein